MSFSSRIQSPIVLAQMISLAVALALFSLTFWEGRNAVFLSLNADLGKIADSFFSFCTEAAEGWVWIPYFILLVALFKKDGRLILYNFLISTLLTQIPKQFIWPAITRPTASGMDPLQIHTVPGIELHSLNSFPSGHTATAFTIFLLTVYFFPQSRIIIIGLCYALLCGYSRIYLGQHFPLDIAGGILVAIASIHISQWLRHSLRNSI